MRKPARLAGLIFGLSLVAPSAPVWTQDKGVEIVQIDLPVLPQLQRHVELLAYPSYLAVAFENSGINPSHRSRLNLVDGRELKLRNGVVKFTALRGGVFSYSAGVRLDIAGAETDITFPIEIDTSKIGSGTLSVRLLPPIAKFVSKETLDRVRYKARLMADASAQQKLISYLDGVSKGATSSAGVTPVLERIMLDAYNRGIRASPAGRPDAGDAEPLSDQVLLIFTLAFWLIAVPAFFLTRRILARRRRATAK